MKNFFTKLLCTCSEEHPQGEVFRQSQREAAIEPVMIANHYSYNSQISRCSTLQIFLNQISFRDLELLLNSKSSSLILQQSTEKYFNFSGKDLCYDQQINFEQLSNHSNDQHEKLFYPQKLAEYITSRFRETDFLFEINSNYNLQSIEFAKAGIFVIAASTDKTKIKHGMHNLQNSHEYKFIDIVNMNTEWLKINLEVFDGIFVNLCSHNIENEINLQKSLMHILTKNENVIILTDQKKGNFVSHFAEQFYFVERQKIFFNNILEYSVFYFGKYCNLKQQNLIEVIKNAFPSCQFQQFNLKASIQEILVELLRVYSKNSLMKVFLDSLRQINSLDELFSSFLKELENKQMISKEKILQIHMRSSTSQSMSKMHNHPSSANQIFAESFNSKKSNNISFNIGMSSSQQLSYKDNESLTSNGKLYEQ